MEQRKELKGLRIFNLFGIPVYINYSWIIIFALVAWSLARYYYPSSFKGGSAQAFWVMGVISSLLLFVCVLLHEFSHSVTALFYKIKVTHITLFIFGGVSNMPKEPDSPRQDMFISAAGPAMSAALCLLCYLLSFLAPEGSAVRAVMLYLTYINGALAVFNILPGFPLDGGRILRDAVWIKTKDLTRAAETASSVGKAVGIGIILLGILSFFQGNVLGGAWFVFIGIFLRNAADQGYQQMSFQNELRGVQVSQIMTENPVSVAPDVSVRSLVEDYFYHYHHVAYPVLEGGNLLGMIDLKRIKSLSKEEWEKVKVGHVMTDLSPEIMVDPQIPASDVLQRLLASEHGRLLVVENGKLLGIIARRDIIDMLRIKSELK